jgi:peptidoglycan hydrolase-like protein with peptidoglycan-binding domain
MTDLRLGARGIEVSLLQAFLIAKSTGPASVALQTEGATGYFGTMTEAAVREYQVAHTLLETGVYDAEFRAYAASTL